MDSFYNFSGQTMTMNTPMSSVMVLLYIYRLKGVEKMGWIRRANCVGKTPIEAFRDRYANGRSGRTFKDAMQEYEPTLLVFDYDSIRKRNEWYLDSTTLDKALAKELIARDIGIYSGPSDKNVEGLIGLVDNWDSALIEIERWCGFRPEGEKEGFCIKNYQSREMVTPVGDLFRQGEDWVVLSTFTGSGKTTLVPYFCALFSNPGEVNLFTTPIIDTMDGLSKAVKRFKYLNKNIVLFTGENLLHPNFDEILQNYRKNGFIIIISLSVQDLRNQTGLDEVGLSRKYAKILNKLNINLWNRDEKHFHYDAEKTKQAFEQFDKVKVRLRLDTTATPFNLIDKPCYQGVKIINFSILNALRLKQQGDPEFVNMPMPVIELFSIPPSSDTKFKEMFSDEEGTECRKMFDCDKKGNFVYQNGLTDMSAKFFAPGLDNKVKFPHAIYASLNPEMAEFPSGLMVIPKGENGLSVTEKGPKFAEILNKRITTTHFIYADDLRSLATTSLPEAVRVLSEKMGKPVVIVTHRKFTTGTDIPQLSFILLLDQISSINVFLQLIGRIMRMYPGKDTARIYVVQPGTELLVTYAEGMKALAQQEGVQLVQSHLDCLPLVCHDSIGSRTVGLSEITEALYKHLDRVAQGAYFTANFVKSFTELSEIVDRLNRDIVPLALNEKQPIKLTAKNDAKSKRYERMRAAIRGGKVSMPGKKSWQETIALMLSESFRIGLIQNCTTIQEVFKSVIARNEFGEINTSFILDVFEESTEFARVVEEYYLKEMGHIRSLTIEEQLERFFRNELYKIKMGLVYTPLELVDEMLENF